MSITYDTGVAVTNDTADFSVSSPGLTTAEDNELIVAMAFCAGEYVSANQWSSTGITNGRVVDSGLSPNANPTLDRWFDADEPFSYDPTVLSAFVVKPTAGSIGTVTATVNSSDAAFHALIIGAFKLPPPAAGVSLTNLEAFDITATTTRLRVTLTL
jgi:hypothetical protein